MNPYKFCTRACWLLALGLLLALGSPAGAAPERAPAGGGTAAVLPVPSGQSSRPDWVQKQTTYAPSEQLLVYAMAYDDALGRIVLFGYGGDGSETWEYDGVDWTQKHPGHAPAVLANLCLAYDSARQRVVMLTSGQTGAETWEYDGTGWLQRHPQATPNAPGYYVMAYDAAIGRVVAFGGLGAVNPISPGSLPDFGQQVGNETWEYDGNNWVQKNPASAPPGRSIGVIAYDSARQRIVLFGGIADQLLNDTWEYDGTTWAETSPADSPPMRVGPSMAYDGTRQRIVLFGGMTLGLDFLDETWEYDGQQWVQAAPAHAPDGRIIAAMAYDRGRDRMVLFGGLNLLSSGFLRDTWEYGPPGSRPAPSPTSTPVAGGPSGGLSGEIAYVTGQDIWLLDVTTRKTQKLTSAARSPFALQWSPNGQWLLYHMRAPDVSVIFNLQTGQHEQLNGTLKESVWAPDSQSIAFVSPDTCTPDCVNYISKLSLPDFKVTNLTSENDYHSSLTFARDGSLYFIGHGFSRIMRLDRSGKESLVLDTLGQASFGDLGPLSAWGNEWLALDNDYPHGAKLVAVLDLRTGKLVRVNGPETCDYIGPWAHNRPLLAFYDIGDCMNSLGHDQVVKVEAFDSPSPQARPIYNAGSLIDWSPDDQWLLLAGSSPSSSGFSIIPAGGGQPQRVSDVGQDPAWRPQVAPPPSTAAPVPPTTTPMPAAATPTLSAQASASICGHIYPDSHNPNVLHFWFFDACPTGNGYYDLRPDPPLQLPAEGYYRIYDPVIASTPPGNNRIGRITGWSRLEPINDCSVCGQGPALKPPQVSITNFTVLDTAVHSSLPDWQTMDAPRVLGTNMLWVQIQNVGDKPFVAQAGKDGYELEVMVKKNGAFWFENVYHGGERGLPLLNEDVDNKGAGITLSIDDLYFFSPTDKATVEVSLKPDASLHMRDSMLSRDIRVIPNKDSWQACAASVAETLIEATDLACDALAPEAATLCRAATKSSDLAAIAVKCKGDRKCEVKETAAWFADTILGEVGEVGEFGGLIGKALAGMGEDPPCMIAVDWTQATLSDWLQHHGNPTNGVIVHSPAYPLVTDAAGRRTGFLPGGQRVTEIPGSGVAQIDEQRFVLFPGTGPVTVQLIGYAAGMMTVDTVFAGSSGNGRIASYRDVPVTPNLRAMLSSADPAAPLQLDTNGDGQVDQTRLPDIREAISSGTPAGTTPTVAPITPPSITASTTQPPTPALLLTVAATAPPAVAASPSPVPILAPTPSPVSILAPTPSPVPPPGPQAGSFWNGGPGIWFVLVLIVLAAGGLSWIYRRGRSNPA